MIRRIGEAYRHDVQYTLRPGAYAILSKGPSVLLTYQGDPHFEYQLPGGGIDLGESPVQALHREVFEETGWRIAAPRKYGVFRRFVFMPEYDLWAEKICHIYLARPAYNVSPPSEPDHEAIWADPDQAAQVLANPGDQHFMARFARGLF